MRRKVTFLKVAPATAAVQGHPPGVRYHAPAQERPEPLQPGVERGDLPGMRSGLLASGRERRTCPAGLPKRQVCVQRVRVDRKGGGEPVSEYRAIYKCRLCGTVFVHHAHANDENEAAKKIVDFALFYSGADVHRRKIPLILQFHKCSDASYGVADFQGMKKVGGSDG